MKYVSYQFVPISTDNGQTSNPSLAGKEWDVFKINDGDDDELEFQ